MTIRVMDSGYNETWCGLVTGCRPDSTAIGQSQLVTPTSKTPPPPPPRWTKPSLTNCTSSQNFTVTTTLTFTVNKETSPSPDLKVRKS